MTHRILVVGCGNMANVWVDYVLQHSKQAMIVGLVDIKREAAEALAERKQLTCPLFTDLQEAIEQTEANVVFDVSIPATHYEVAKTAMELGCHVFAEKPLAESLEQCLELVQLSKTTGRTHAIMQNRRFDPRIRSLRHMIEEGTIGRVGFVAADFFIGAHFGGFRDAMQSPLLIDMAIHTFDQARMILAADPVTVYCHEFNPYGSWYEGNAMALCIYEMSDGSVFDYRGSWCAEGARTSWEAAWRVIGDKGTIIWDGHSDPYADIVSPDQEGKFLYDVERVESEPVDMAHTFHHGCLDDMLSSLSEHRQPETHSADNIYSMAMVLAAIESARTGQKVDIRAFMER